MKHIPFFFVFFFTFP
ncbi:pheA operon leader peptide PheL [Escherichia coli]|nr:pheA operon leader peptide PheL [Escherichia coli]